MTGFCSSPDGSMAERLSALALRSAMTPGWSCVSVTSPLWVVEQGTDLTEPQLSLGLLKGLKEIR